MDEKLTQARSWVEAASRALRPTEPHSTYSAAFKLVQAVDYLVAHLEAQQQASADPRPEHAHEPDYWSLLSHHQLAWCVICGAVKAEYDEEWRYPLGGTP